MNQDDDDDTPPTAARKRVGDARKEKLERQAGKEKEESDDEIDRGMTITFIFFERNDHNVICLFVLFF